MNSLRELDRETRFETDVFLHYPNSYKVLPWSKVTYQSLQDHFIYTFKPSKLQDPNLS